MPDRIKVSPNFYEDEFACPCCGGVFHLKQRLLDGLEEFRTFCGVGLAVNHNGGQTRCRAYQAAIYTERGKDINWGSRHLTGEGVDIHKVDGGFFTQKQFDKAKEIFGGVGVPASRKWLHVDVGPKRSWKY